MSLSLENLTLERVLEVENSPDFLEFICPITGVLAWPTIRMQVIRMFVSDLLYQPQTSIIKTPKRPLLRTGLMTLRTVAHNLANRPQPSRALIYATGAGVLEKRGHSFNRYTGHFSESLHGDTWSIEGLPWLTWPLPRSYGRLSFSTPAVALMYLRSRLSDGASLRLLAHNLVTLVATRARTLLGWELGKERSDWLALFCARQLACYPLRKRYIEQLLHDVKPRLLLVEEGCYGHMAIVNATAHDLGVPIAEFQHGVVSKGHDAYNIAPILANSDAYRHVLPDYFLGYGEWWNKQINVPVKKLAVGNPYRSELIDALSTVGLERHHVLVLGEGFDTDLYLRLCSELGSLLPEEFKVVFRPHPLERSRVLEMPTDSAKGFSIDRTPDIYPSLANAYAVIAELSTGLFEAVGLAERIFVWNTAKSRFSLPEHPFAHFDDVADLAQKLHEPQEGRLSAADSEEFWASDWQQRFKEFVDRVAYKQEKGLKKR